MYRNAILRAAANNKAPAPATSKVAAPTSTTETMMPWDGWFSSFVKAKLGSERYEQLKDFILFKNDDIHDLHGIPNPSTKVDIGGGEKVQFRYPSPGSQTPVKMPDMEEGGDPFNINYYSRDTRRTEVPVLTAVRDDYVPKSGETLVNADDMKNGVLDSLKVVEESSPGNKGNFATGKSNFDPSGLRAAMSTSHEAVEANMKKLMPTGSPGHVSDIYCTISFLMYLFINSSQLSFISCLLMNGKVMKKMLLNGTNPEIFLYQWVGAQNFWMFQ